MTSQDSTPASYDVSAQAEAFLFLEGGTMSKRTLAGKLHIDQSNLQGVLALLTQQLKGRGLVLVQTETEVSLAVSPLIRTVIESELQQDQALGDAGLEVLAIILYRGPSTKSRIDYIRGVNTSSTLRTLLARGLIERTSNAGDSHEYLYRPTTALLAHLGVTNIEDLPEYGKIASALADFENQKEPLGHTDSHGNTTLTAHTE
jgi:segregation and condensation protein B